MHFPLHHKTHADVLTNSLVIPCIIRPGLDTSPVPGCSGEGSAGLDYCYVNTPETLRLRSTTCSPESPCEACEGVSFALSYVHVRPSLLVETHFGCYQTKLDRVVQSLILIAVTLFTTAGLRLE